MSDFFSGLLLCVPVCLCECMHMGQVSDRALNSPEPRLQAVKSHLSWVLTTKLDSFRIGNAAKLPNYLFSPFYFNYGERSLFFDLSVWCFECLVYLDWQLFPKFGIFSV